MAASESPIRRPIPEKDTHDGVGRLPWSISNSTWSFFQTPTQLGKQEYVHTLKLKSMRRFRDAHQSVVPRSIPILVTLAIRRVMMMHDEWSIGWRQMLNALEPILNHYCPMEQIKTCELFRACRTWHRLAHHVAHDRVHYDVTLPREQTWKIRGRRLRGTSIVIKIILSFWQMLQH